MSRTFKDAPAARRARRDRRFAEREIQFAYRPAAGGREVDTAVPADTWDAFANGGLSRESRLAAAKFLGLTGEPSDAELAAAPCPHFGEQLEERCRWHVSDRTLGIDRTPPDPAAEQRHRAAEGRVLGDVLARAELFLIAGGQ